jgi:hypothetical protein
MANISFQLNPTGQNTAALAITNGMGGSAITVWTDDVNNSGTVNSNDDVYTTESQGVLSGPFAGGNQYYAIQEAAGSINAAQIDNSGEIISISTIDFGSSEASPITIPAGGVGDTIVINNITLAAGTVTAVTPATYQLGSTTYDVDITVPAGYSNSGSTITLQSTATGTTTTAPPAQTFTILVTDSNGATPSPLEFNEGDTINVTIQASVTGGTTSLDLVGSTAVEADFTTWPTEIGTGNTTATLDFSNATTVPLQFTVSNDFSDNTNSGGSPEGSETIVLTLTDGTTETITIIDSSQNQPPVTSDVNATITQTGGALNFVTIDLSAGTNDPEGNPNNSLEWVISDIPANGTFRDPVLSGVDLTVNDLPYTLPGYELRYYPGTIFQGTETVTGWLVSDPNGGQSNTSDIIINVTAPTNQDPVATNVSETISGTGAGINVNFSRAATDDLIGGALQPFQWCLADGTPQTLAQINATLTYGSVSNIAAEVWQYTTNASATLNPGASSVDDTFYFLATDAAGGIDVGQVQIQITAPGNTAPYFNVSNPAPIAIDQGTAHVVSNIATTDPEGHTVTITKIGQGGTDTGANATLSGNTLTVVGSSPGTVTVTLRATDQFGLSDQSNDVTYTFNVTAVPYRAVRHSSFSNSDAAACGLERPISEIYYYNTGQGGATFLANLAIGDVLYQDSSLTLPVVPNSSNSAWVSLEETSQQTVKAAKLNATTGAIEEFLNCTITGGNAWSIVVRYSENSSLYCGGLYEEGEAWQNIGPTATLTDVVSVGGQLFPDEFSANQYSGATAPTDRILADGIYNQEDDPEIPSRGYYSYNNGWQTNPNPEPNDPTNDPNAVAQVNRLYVCPPDIVYQTKSLDCYFLSQDPANVSAVCNAMTEVEWDDSKLNFDAITIYYRQDVNDNDTWSLLDIAKNQTLVYTDQNAADSLNYNLLQPTSILLDSSSGGFVLWDNNEFTGYDGSYKWYAFSPDDGNVATQDNILEVADIGSIYGACGDGITGPSADYERPNLFEIQDGLTNIGVGTNSGTGTNVYYVFYACDSELDPGVPGGSPYYPVYLVDGMVENIQMLDPGYSYINDFVRTITGTSKNTRAQIKLGGKCLTYTNYVVATNIEEAVAFMEAEIEGLSTDNIALSGAGDVPARVVSINAIDLGFASEAQASWLQIDNANKDTICYTCLTQTGNWTLYDFPTIDNAEILNRTLPNFDLEENYVLDGVSKPLLRTNPKLSTNVKLVVNNDDRIYIESIDATKELASVEYKRWELNPNGDWSQDLYKFFKSSSTPADIMYATRSDYSDFTVQDSFDKQIEEVYHYGTTYNYSKLHDEDFRMLAPIWLDKDIPKRFVVFRVNDPVGELDFDDKTNFNNIQDILKHSQIIKTFDLTDDSSIGKYIRNHVNSESFPKTPIQFNFSKGEKSNFRGIDLGKGGFTSKGEYLHKDFVYTDNPLISSNALITDGFERNKLACANLINLEFLFNDDGASDYTINRYFGLYVNDIDSGYGSLSSADNGNIIFNSLNSQINEDPTSAIPSFKHISGTPTLGYMSISNEFYKISSKAKYDPENLNLIVEDDTNKIPAEIKTAENDKSVDIVKEDSVGFDFVKFTVTGTPAVNDRFTVFESRESSYSLKFLRHIPNEQWNLSFNNGGNVQNMTIVTQSNIQGTVGVISAAINSNNINVTYDETINPKEFYITEKNATLGDLEISFNAISPLTSSSIVKITQIQSSLNLGNSTFFATHNLEPGTFNQTSFSLQGSFADIARAISGAINASSINFDAVIEDGATEFYVKNRVSGYKLLQSGVLIPFNNANNFITLENRDLKSDGLPNGELRLANNVATSNFVHFMKGGNSAGKSVLITKDSVSDINIGDMLATSSTGVFNKVIDIVDDISNSNTIYKKLILESKNTLESGEQKVYAENIARLGLFSAYDIHDMNFDFYDTKNSDLKELELETATNINYEPERSTSNTLSVFGNDYDITDPYSYFSGISDVLPEEILDEYNEVKLSSEYDRLEENNLKEFAVRSRVTPNINKWVLKDSLTVREQPYYLNANEAFGRTNFSPDFGANNRDRLGMTHEWFYMDNLPKYLQYTDLNNTFSYVNFMDGFELKPSHFKSTTYNYFDKFMITDGFEIKDQYDINTFIKTDLKKKYTLISGGNDVSFASTIFKGIKVDFKNRKEFLNNKATEFVKTSDFNGYKFSTLLLVRGGANRNGVEYEIIQNKAFKFVIFLITVSLDDLWIDGALNRKLMYEMNHSFVWNHEERNFSYSDVKLSGALNLNDINFTAPSAANYLIANGIEHSDGTLPQFLDQINPDDDDAFGEIFITITDSTGETTIKVKINSVDDQGQITLAGPPVDLNGNSVNVSNIAGYIQRSAEYVYKQGGKNAFTTILDQLAVANVDNLLKLNDGDITYTTIEEDGEVLNNQFELEFENGVEIIKEASLVTISDEDKPKTFKLKQGTIGYNLFSADTYYPFLVRHNGNYTLDTRPVVTFTDTYSHFKTNTLQTSLNTRELNFEEPIYKHSLTRAEEIKLARDYYKRYNRCGTAFNLGFIQDNGIHDSEWGIIKNHFYRKVNESGATNVTKLSATTDKLPLYPLIGEVAIDKKDVNVFRSSWDKNYYTRSLSGGLAQPVPGTFETKEERSYLGSTIMKVKDSYNMTQFTTTTVKTQKEQDSILANNNNTTDVVLFEDKKYVYIDFYITTTIKKLLAQDGVLDSINKYVAAVDSAGDKTTTKDDALLYVEDNLINTFNLDIIKIYSNRIKGVSSEILSSASIDNLDDGGYKNDINFTFKSHEQKPLNFRLIYNKRLGYSYMIRPMVKIKS